MVLLWTLLPCFGIFVLVSCEWETPKESEGIAKAHECYSDILSNSDISHLLLDVTDPPKIDAFCGRISRMKKCIADNEHYLSVAENTDYLLKTRGISSFYINVCPPGTELTSQYKGNAPCFRLIKDHILSCGSDLPDMNSYKMKTDAASRCCALEQHRICMYRAVSQYCGSEAGGVTEKILFKYFQTYWNGCEEILLTCSDYGYTFRPDIRRSSQYPSDSFGSRNSRRRFYGHPDNRRQTESEGKWSDCSHTDEWQKHVTTATPTHTSSVSNITFNTLSLLFGILLQIVLLQSI